jgi:hypothetical protein
LGTANTRKLLSTNAQNRTIHYQYIAQPSILIPLQTSKMFNLSISFAATRRVYLMGLLAFSIAVAIAATLWAAIKIKNPMFTIPLLILLVLLSVAEGALGEFILGYAQWNTF